MRHIQKLLVPVTLLLCISVTIASAQVDCPTMVQEAIAATGEVCAEIERNQACYGNVSLNATFQEDAGEVTFVASGDIADVASIETLTVDPYDEEAGTWGIAVLKLQANLPDTSPGQNVTMVLFGDVQIENASVPSEGEELEGEELTPMQAFYFRTGVGDSPCEEAPDSGILIQTPEGATNVELVVNGVNVSLGSTAFLQAEEESDFVFSTVEGAATVEAEGETQPIPAGTQATIPMDEELQPAGPPTEPEPYDDEALSALPIEILPEEIEIADALTDEELAAALEGGSSGGEVITEITPGTWTYSFTTFEGCGIDSSMIESMPATTLEVESAQISDFLTQAATAGSQTMSVEGMEMGVTNPEPNLYVIEFGFEGGSVYYEYLVVSPDLIEITGTIDNGDCTITISATLEHTGD